VGENQNTTLRAGKKKARRGLKTNPTIERIVRLPVMIRKNVEEETLLWQQTSGAFNDGSFLRVETVRLGRVGPRKGKEGTRV